MLQRGRLVWEIISSEVATWVLWHCFPPHPYQRSGKECTCAYSSHQAETGELQESHLESLTWKSRVCELQRLVPDPHLKKQKGEMVAGQLSRTAEQKGLHWEWLDLCWRWKCGESWPGVILILPKRLTWRSNRTPAASSPDSISAISWSYPSSKPVLVSPVLSPTHSISREKGKAT